VEVEVVEIERLLQPGPPDATYIWAIATHLPAFYTGCESVIRLRGSAATEASHGRA